MFSLFVSPTFLFVSFGLVCLVASLLYYEDQRDKKLPPGPPRLPLIGNVHQAPATHAFRQYRLWNLKYGPIFSLQYGLDTLIVIGSHAIAKDLLDKRSTIYSSRPRLVMAQEMLSKGLNTLLRPYDARFRLHQRMEAPVLNKRASETYRVIQDMESKQVLHDFLGSNDFRHVFERYTASVVYTLTYGYRLQTGHEQILRDAHQVQDRFGKAAQVGSWIVDIIPALNILPEIFAPWKKFAEDSWKNESAIHLRNMDAGLSTAGWNWTKHLSSSREASSMPKLEVAYDLGILADAGLDTTTVSLEVFVLAALKNPRVQEKARKLLDEVVGEDRLPGFKDRDALVYCEAIVLEVLRWRPVAPGGVPHMCTEEDEYMGYRIPKNSIVIWNAWSIGMDSSVFPQPEQFIPERWIGEDGQLLDLPVVGFGYGRRKCPGRHIARNSLFLAVSRVLWAFEIVPALDAEGKPIEVDDMNMTDGLASKPVHFPCVFRERNERVRRVIEREWEGADKDVDVHLNGIAEARKI